MLFEAPSFQPEFFPLFKNVSKTNNVLTWCPDIGGQSCWIHDKGSTIDFNKGSNPFGLDIAFSFDAYHLAPRSVVACDHKKRPQVLKIHYSDGTHKELKYVRTQQPNIGDIWDFDWKDLERRDSERIFLAQKLAPIFIDGSNIRYISPSLGITGTIPSLSGQGFIPNHALNHYALPDAYTWSGDWLLLKSGDWVRAVQIPKGYVYQPILNIDTSRANKLLIYSVSFLQQNVKDKRNLKFAQLNEGSIYYSDDESEINDDYVWVPTEDFNKIFAVSFSKGANSIYSKKEHISVYVFDTYIVAEVLGLKVYISRYTC